MRETDTHFVSITRTRASVTAILLGVSVRGEMRCIGYPSYIYICSDGDDDGDSGPLLGTKI